MPKKSGNWHSCYDYRTLNLVTVPDRYPLFHIHDLAENFAGATMFPTIDFLRVYIEFWLTQPILAKLQSSLSLDYSNYCEQDFPSDWEMQSNLSVMHWYRTAGTSNYSCIRWLLLGNLLLRRRTLTTSKTSIQQLLSMWDNCYPGQTWLMQEAHMKNLRCLRSAGLERNLHFKKIRFPFEVY